eukprot:SAG31_NODE_48208_length_197_cov_36.816327_1_plen_65_part_11
MNLGPTDMLLISVLIRTGFIAAMTSLDLSNNPGILGELNVNGWLQTADAHVEEFKQLATAIGQLP